MRTKSFRIGDRVLQVPVKTLVIGPAESSTGIVGRRVQVKRRRKGFFAVEGDLGAQTGPEPQSGYGLDFQVGITYDVMRPVVITQAGSDIRQRVSDLLTYDGRDPIRTSLCISSSTGPVVRRLCGKGRIGNYRRCGGVQVQGGT